MGTATLAAMKWPFLLLLLLAGAAASGAGTSDASRADRRRPADVDTRGTPGQVFARIRRAELDACAKDQGGVLPGFGGPMPAPFDALFAAVEAGDAAAVSNAYVALYSDPGVRAKARALWQPAHEVGGFYELCPRGDDPAWREMADEILGHLPAGAVYFGGTDSGRFIATTYREVRNAPAAFVFTQNQLADDTYLGWARWLYGRDLDLPDKEDVARIFTQYLDDAQAGRVEARGVALRDGRAEISGVDGVMAVNGRIARAIFDRNAARHPFFVEESYVIPWMYPHAEPAGPILRLHERPLAALSPSSVDADRAYWNGRTAKLLAEGGVPAGHDALQAWARMRAAIGGVYASRRMWAEAEYAYRQADRISPGLPEPNYRLADALAQQGKFAEAAAVAKTLAEHRAGDAAAEAYAEQMGRAARKDARRAELEGRMRAGARPSVALELAGLYAEMNMTPRLASLADRLLSEPDLPAAACRTLADLCRGAQLTNQAAAAEARAGKP